MPQRPGLRVSISPDEILFGSVTIRLESDLPLDPKGAQSAIVVRGWLGHVRLSRGGRLADWVPDRALTPGHHVLSVGELLSANGRPIGPNVRIPFFLTDSVAAVPPTIRVHHLTRLRVHELHTQRLRSDRRPDGAYIEILKAMRRTTGAPVRLAFDEAGRPVDAERILRGVLENRVRKFGKLHETLHAAMEAAAPGVRIPIAVWIRCDDALAPDEKRRGARMDRPPKSAFARREAIREATTRFVRAIEREIAAPLAADAALPVLYVSATTEQIASLASNGAVLGIFLHETDGIDDLGTALAIANADDVQTAGFTGRGVNVAVWENAPDNTTNLVIAARYKTSGLTTSTHARHTHGIVRNNQPMAPNGFAPGCALHSANTKAIEALEWAASTRGCTVISQSFHRSSEPGSSGLSFDDCVKDLLALQWPFPTICQAAGNFWSGDADDIDPPSAEYVNHKGFNGIVVGNHNDTATGMVGSSVFRNPTSPSGDRELPEICANGDGVTAVGITDTGTSMATPAVAGCAALLQEAHTGLQWWPEGCRAILFAGATRNVADGTWWNDVVAGVDASDGAGAVDAQESVAIAQQLRWRGAPPTRRGWDVGTLRPTDFDALGRSVFAYRVRLSPFKLAPRHVKIALAWNSKVTTLEILGMEFVLSALTVDLDLLVLDSRGLPVAHSSSLHNSYEIAEFDGRPGETYTVLIQRWTGSDVVSYGIAWTVTGPEIVVGPIDDLTIGRARRLRASARSRRRPRRGQ